MSGSDDELLPEGVPPFDDPTHEDLRAELAGLGDIGPMPADVIARLDDVLAGLPARSSSVHPAASVHDGLPAESPVVVPLRRRSRLGPRLLAAAGVAAVLAVGGIAIGQQGLGGSGDSGAAADKAVSAEAGAGTAADPGAATAAPEAASRDTTVEKFAILDSAGVVPELTRSGFAAQAGTLLAGDATALRSSLDARTPVPAPAAPQSGDASTDLDELASGSLSYTARSAGCTGSVPTPTAGSVVYPILLDRVPALLVVQPERDGRQVVEARDCTGTTVLTSTTLPATAPTPADGGTPGE